jgi:hypothetical protein
MGPRAQVGGRSARAYYPGPGLRTLYAEPGTRRRPFLTHTHTVHVEPLATPAGPGYPAAGQQAAACKQHRAAAPTAAQVTQATCMHW